MNGGWKKPARKTPGKGGVRYYKNVGLGFKTPKEAIEGESCSASTPAICSGSGRQQQQLQLQLLLRKCGRRPPFLSLGSIS